MVLGNKNLFMVDLFLLCMHSYITDDSKRGL
nr:MAG TPA: hypothetical protein [Caudoviricetes sp.]